MRHKRPFYQAMQELQKLYKDLDGAGDALQMQLVMAVERTARDFKKAKEDYGRPKHQHP